MVSLAYANAVLVDTSAVVALVNESDPLHQQATACLEQLRGENLLCAVNVTAHESFTRLRYGCTLELAGAGYALLRCGGVRTLEFVESDEEKALTLARKYTDKTLSFHDSLCAAVMLRHAMYRVFSFDADFWAFGFEVLPGVTRPR
jgi:predicted nucleic acid-binding protein